MSCKRLNLSNYSHCSKEEADLVIIPQKAPDGTELPPIYFKKIETKRFKPKVTTTADAIWDPTVIVDPTGTPKEYCSRVAWWFSSATDDYINTLRTAYNMPAFAQEVEKARAWLLTRAAHEVTANGKWASRKEHIGRFVTNWLAKSQQRGARAGGPR
jgi:hypothetical protein